MGRRRRAAAAVRPGEAHARAQRAPRRRAHFLGPAARRGPLGVKSAIRGARGRDGAAGRGLAPLVAIAQKAGKDQEGFALLRAGAELGSFNGKQVEDIAHASTSYSLETAIRLERKWRDAHPSEWAALRAAAANDVSKLSADAAGAVDERDGTTAHEQ